MQARGLLCRLRPRGGFRGVASASRLQRAARRFSSSAAAASAASAASGSRWSAVPMGPRDPILGVSEAFKADPAPVKLNLGVGAYRDDQGKPLVLPSVRKAEARMVEEDMDMEYSPIGGQAAFTDKAVRLAFGEETFAKHVEGRHAALQSLSGTGALRLIGGFIGRFADGNATKRKIYVPDPTWGNHHPIFRDSGLEVETYRYFDSETGAVAIDAMCEDLHNMEDGASVLLHACAHNPTGADPTPEQWSQISDLLKKKGGPVVVDMAYQGFASGDTDRDNLGLVKLVNDGHRVFLAQSFAKNFGLYGQRAGCMTMLTEDAEEASRVESQLKILARAAYSSPPIHGARIVTTVLSDPELAAMWREDVAGMANRIIRMRTLLREGLEKAGSTRDWSRITSQIGMFAYSGLTGEQVDRLAAEHHVYLTRNGRISLAGLTTDTVPHLVKAIRAVE